jgi:tRNA uridine 5-carboxymethylaminomethyl modification enzyme
VGGGHAGLEAAFAAARVGARVCVVTGSISTVGQTPCNPSVGGVGKAHLVAEIDAMGGFMGRAADATAIHGKRLNTRKGPAVQATRLQVDKARYGLVARQALADYPGVETREGLVTELLLRDSAVRGVRCADGSEIEADAVVLTTGTFLGGLLHTGRTQTPGGRVGEAPATRLSECLRELGLCLSRLKTGTPARLRRDSIDYSRLQAQPSDEPFPRFTLPDEPDQPPRLAHVDCHLTYTNPRTHAIIEANIHESPMYSGQIKGVGPRYCPSVEDKIVRFAGRDRHQVFLEPEGLDDDLVYPNGISTSLPLEVQRDFVATIEGLENAEIVRPGYAVEYDAVDARSLTHELRSKDISGLYFAGQINGTSGYEEAGAQGLLAGANAALSFMGRPTLELRRDQAYAGVMVDDLVTQGCDEPYRMFTSRAEFRILLREDNADERLSLLAFEAGLIEDGRYERVKARTGRVDRAETWLAKGGSLEADDTELGAAGLARWEVSRAHSRRTYSGYVERLRIEVERMQGEGLPLAENLDYYSLAGLSHESAERLARVRPRSTGQAARIRGMTPAALACLWAHARSQERTRDLEAS